MKRNRLLPLFASTLVAGLVSCGGGGSSSPVAPAATSATPATPTAPTIGFSVPSEISPVAASTSAAAAMLLPAQGPATAAARAPMAFQSPRAAAVGTDPGTDYSLAGTSRFVSENAIDQFSTIETILNAIAQTHYADAANIGAGPYKSIVSWQQNNSGNSSKDIQTWVVDSSIIQVNGAYVNQVKCWIEDQGSLVKALFLISASATQNADGSYKDYGTWTVNAKFDDAGDYYFEAQASVSATGETVVAINQKQQGGQGLQVNQGVMHKTATTGYGKVSYPLQTQNNQASTQVTDAYTYNAGQLLIQDTASQAKVYKDRATSVELDQQYGMFDGVTGDDVLKTHSFGFPISFQSNGSILQGYYGACQGSSNVWLSDNSIIPDGTTVTRMDQGNAGATYQTASFTGTLTRRTLVPADISDLLNLPVQTWANFMAQLTWNGTAWMMNGTAFTDFASLVAQPQMNVMISGGGGMNQPMVNYLYLPSVNGSTAGFYSATPGPNGQWMSTGQRYAPSTNDTLFVNINGSIYIEYLGATTGWVQKTLTSFDTSSNTPTFAPQGDTPYTLQLNQQYYIINQGGNYVVTATAPETYTVQAELLTSANPANASSVLGTVSTFRPQNYDPTHPTQTSSFTYSVDPASAKFLRLCYATVGTQDALATPAPKVGDVVSQGQGSLTGLDASGVGQGQYNWDYPMQGQNFGIQTFLYTASNGVRTYKLLDQPIGLAPMVLHTSDGTAKTLSLQYDGWMQGLPQFNNQLSINGYTMTSDIATKIVNIPAGTVATSATNPAVTYLIKPLQEALYLLVAATPDTTLDLTSALAINLAGTSTLPQYSDNGLGTEPAITTISYSEGNPVH